MQHRIYTVWMEEKLVPISRLPVVEYRLSLFGNLPSCGTLPRTASDTGSNWTNGQWRMWSLCLSQYCLQEMLPEQHMRCWRWFQRGCWYVSERILSPNDFDIAEVAFFQFVKEYQKLYLKKNVKPWNHMMLHLIDSLKSEGGIYAAWSFPHERINKLMGASFTSGRASSASVEYFRRYEDLVLVSENQQNPKELEEEYIVDSNYYKQYLQVHCSPISSICGCEKIMCVVDKAYETTKCLTEEDFCSLRQSIKAIAKCSFSYIQRSVKVFIYFSFLVFLFFCFVFVFVFLFPFFVSFFCVNY